MQFSLLLAIVAAIAVSENAPAHPVPYAGARLCLAVLGIATVLLLAAASSLTVSRALRDPAADRDSRWWLLWFARRKRVHQALWLVVGGSILYALDWPQLVRYNWNLGGLLLVEDVLILAPVWMPLLLSWAAFYEVERALHAAGNAANQSRSPLSRTGYVWLQARTHLGLCVLPVLLLLLFQDTVSLVDPHWQRHELAWVIFLIPVAVLVLAFPQLLSTIWKTSPLPAGPLRDRLNRLAHSQDVVCHDFRIWDTQGQVMNAAVAGVLARTRCVFLTDALLEHLDDEEIAAVIVHELGHIRRRHLLLRMLLLALPVWILGCLRITHPQVEQFLNQAAAPAASTVSTLHCLVITGAVMLYAFLVLGRYSRLLEFDADTCVYRAGHAPEFIAALWKLSALSGASLHRSSWLHPSPEQRIRALREAVADPDSVTRFRHRVHCVNLALLAMFLCAPLLLASLAGN